MPKGFDVIEDVRGVIPIQDVVDAWMLARRQGKYDHDEYKTHPSPEHPRTILPTASASRLNSVVGFQSILVRDRRRWQSGRTEWHQIVEGTMPKPSGPTTPARR